MGTGATSWMERRWAWLAVVAAIALVLIVNPTGYAGGGRDDTRYVDAARCWVDAGRMCLPHDHWMTRWPAIAPLAAAIEIGGLNRAAVSLGTIPAYLLGVAMIGWLSSLWFSRAAGLVAACLFACVPAVAVLALRPNVDMIELTAQLAALALATRAIRSGNLGLTLAAGACAGLAVAARDTSLLFSGLAAVAWFLFAPTQRKLLLWAAIGFGAVIVAEMLAYWLATGDPLLRFRLALAHGSVPSSELAKWVDTSRSPILNPQFIAGWKRTIGIELWWPIDPWLNLFASPQIGPWLLTAPLAVVAARESMSTVERQKLVRIGFGAVLLALGIVYGLAIDPKTRAFLLPLSGATLALGWAIARLGKLGRKGFAAALFLGLTFLGLFALSLYQTILPLERAAHSFLRANPGAIEMDAQTKGTLLLVPGVVDAPIAPSGKPLRLTIRTEACAESLKRSLDAGRITLEGSVMLDDHSSLCLVRYR